MRIPATSPFRVVAVVGPVLLAVAILLTARSLEQRRQSLATLPWASCSSSRCGTPAASASARPISTSGRPGSPPVRVSKSMPAASAAPSTSRESRPPVTGTMLGRPGQLQAVGVGDEPAGDVFRFGIIQQ